MPVHILIPPVGCRITKSNSSLLFPLSSHLHRQPRQHAPHHPALQHHPTRPACQEPRNRPRHHRNHRIHGDADDDLYATERHRLHQNTPMPRRNELRQQRQIHDGNLGIGQISDQAHEKQFARPIDGQVAHGKRRASARLDGLPGQVQQIGGAAEAQRIVGVGHGKDKGGNAEGGAQHVEQEADCDATERDEAGAAALADGAGNQVDHVGAGRQRHAQGHESNISKAVPLSRKWMSWADAIS